MTGRFILAFFALSLLSAAAAAQDEYPLVVYPGAISGIEEQAWRDIVEESAFIAQDFGGYDVHRYYEVADLYEEDIDEWAMSCIDDFDCYFDALYETFFEYALIVSVVAVDGGVEVTYDSLDLLAGTPVSTQVAYMADELDFGALLDPAETALSVTPEHMMAQQPEPEPTPIVTPDPTPLPPIVNDIEDDRARSSLGEAGRWTAIGGGVFLAGGMLFGFAADDTQQEIQSEPHSTSELEDLQSRGKSQQTLANVFYGVGAAALATGVTLIILDSTRDDDRAARNDRRFAIGTTGRTVTFDARW